MLVGSLAIGLVIRLFTLWQTSSLGLPITDEQHYATIARNILAGNGFAWEPGLLTSIRPPLYPGLLALVWSVFGADSLQPVRVLQILLALGLSAIVYALGKRTFNPAVGRLAAAICWLYPSLIFSNFLILTETLFTFLLMAFVLLVVRLVQEPRPAGAILCGIALGLAALTRSVLWPVPLLLCPLLLVLLREPLVRRLTLSAAVLVGYVVVIAPWAIRNTRLQEVTTIVDTMGGINLRMGNYEYTPDDRMWDAVSLKGEQSWVKGFATERPDQAPTEGRKDKWAQAKAIEYMKAHPAQTFRRSLIKFADFWGLEREFIAGVQQGIYHPPRWMAYPAAALIVLAYALLAMAGAAGFWLAAPRDWRLHVLMLFPVLLILGAHTLVFGHSRYHLPLMPIFGLYAAHLVVARDWRALPRPLYAGAAVTLTALVAIWLRQIVFTDLARIGKLFN